MCLCRRRLRFDFPMMVCEMLRAGLDLLRISEWRFADSLHVLKDAQIAEVQGERDAERTLALVGEGDAPQQESRDFSRAPDYCRASEVGQAVNLTSQVKGKVMPGR